MATIRSTDAFNLLALYKKQFGYVALPFPGLIGRAGDYVGDPAATAGLRPYVPGGKPPGQLSNGAPYTMPCLIDNWQLPYEPIVTVEPSKTIVRTELAGYNGSVKENMGLNDYAITVSGVVINDDAEDYPEADVTKLRHLFEKKVSVSISSPITDLFGITLFAIESMSLPAEEGLLTAQFFQLRGYSDIDVDLLIQDGLETRKP